MSHNIYVSFESRDAAELASSRLRRKGIAFRFALRETGSAGPDYAGSPAAINFLYPYQPINTNQNHTNTGNSQYYARSIVNAETAGLPFYAGAGETRVRVTVDDESYDEARAILRNCGGYAMR